MVYSIGGLAAKGLGIFPDRPLLGLWPYSLREGE